MNQLSLFRERRRRQNAGKLAAKKAQTQKRVSQAARAKQAPKTPCVYVLALNEGLYKIGGTADLHRRLDEHRKEKKLPPFTLHGYIPSDEPKWAERYLHGVLSGYRVSEEVYDLPPDALAWLGSLGRLDRDNEPTPPEHLLPRVRSGKGRYSRRTTAGPKPGSKRVITYRRVNGKVVFNY